MRQRKIGKNVRIRKKKFSKNTFFLHSDKLTFKKSLTITSLHFFGFIYYDNEQD